MIAHAAQEISLTQSWICWWVGPKGTQKLVWIEPSPGLGAQHSVGIWHRTVFLPRHKEGHCDPGTGQEWRHPSPHNQSNSWRDQSRRKSILCKFYTRLVISKSLEDSPGELSDSPVETGFPLSAVTHAPCLLGWEGNWTESECGNFQHNYLLYDWASPSLWLGLKLAINYNKV